MVVFVSVRIFWAVQTQVILGATLTISFASSIFFSTSRIVLFLNSGTYKKKHLCDKYLNINLKQVAARSYLQLILGFCWLFSHLYLLVEFLVHLRGLQTFLKTLFKPRIFQLHDFLAEVENAYDETRN